MSNALAKIDGFLRLGKGWHYGAGSPASSALVGRAKLLINLFHSQGFANVDAFPGVDGEIMISAFENGHCIELTLELDGTFRLLHEENGEEILYLENLSTYKLAKHFSFATSKVKLKEWLSSGSFTPVTTTPARESSKTWHSGQQGTRPPSPASNLIAPLNEAVEYANMPESIINQSPTTLPSSGFSTNPTFLPQAA
jgi:hypothetical protein